MAESNGLLDLMKSPAAMGLLAAGFGGLAGANRNTPYNNLGRAGLAGLAGYSAADALQQNQAKLDEAERVKKAIPGLYRTGANGQTSFDALEAARMGINPKLIAEYAAVPNAGRAKVKNTIYVPGINGEKVAIQQDEYGSQVGEGKTAYVPPQLVDTGGTKQFVTPAAGQSFQVGMSPAEVLANQRGQQSLALRQQNNQILADANDINKEAQRTQIVAGADGVNYLVDKGTGSARPAMSPDGKPVVSGQAAEDAKSRERNANDATELLDLVDKTLPGATGSGIGASTDAAGRYFGYTSEGGQKAAQLEALGGALVMKMPRMEGPQSNLDQLLYREMAGKIGDRTVPVEERRAARQVVGTLLTKYATNKQEAPSGGNLTSADNPPANPQRTIARTGIKNGRKIILFSDGSAEYAD